MVVEKVIFNLLAVILFVIIFAKLIKNNDNIYINILVIQFIGIGINFIELVFSLKANLFFKILMYFLSVIIPIIAIFVERKKISLTESLGILKARILMLLNKDDEAKKVMLKLIDKYPKTYMGHKILAQIYEQKGDISTAIEEYVRAVEGNLKDYDSYFKIAGLLQKIEKTDQAIIMLNDLLKKKPDFYEASDLLGDILYEQGSFKEAISVYLDALKYNPAKYELYYNLGMVYTRLNNFQEAKEYYERAAKLNTLLYNGKFNIGQIALILDDLDEAEKYFMECLNGEDVEAGSYYYLAQIAMLKGEKEKAINYLNIALEIEPEIYKDIEEQSIFIPIKGKIKISNNKNIILNKLTKKERETQRHLYNTYYLVGSLNNNDIDMMMKIKKQEIEKEEKTK